MAIKFYPARMDRPLRPTPSRAGLVLRHGRKTIVMHFPFERATYPGTSDGTSVALASCLDILPVKDSSNSGKNCAIACFPRHDLADERDGTHVTYSHARFTTPAASSITLGLILIATTRPRKPYDIPHPDYRWIM